MNALDIAHSIIALDARAENADHQLEEANAKLAHVHVLAERLLPMLAVPPRYEEWKIIKALVHDLSNITFVKP